MKNTGVIVALAAALFGFPWLAVTLIANMNIVPSTSSEGRPALPGNVGRDGSITIEPSMVQGLNSSELITLAAIASSVVAILIWRLTKRRRRKDDYYWHVETMKANPLVPFALLGLVAITFYGLFVLLENNPTILTEYTQVAGVPALLPYLAVGVMLLSSAVGLALFLSTSRPPRFRPGGEVSSGKVEQARFADIINQTVRALERGSDYRTAILNCYRAICQILDRDGTTDSSKLTAREFESLVAGRLNIGRTYLHEATLLFEKARYSADPVYDDDVRRSQICLTRLREEVQTSHSEQKVRV